MLSNTSYPSLIDPMEFDFTYLISQILAAIAFAFGIIAFQFKARSTVLKFWFGCAICNALHFFTLSRPDSGILAVITGLRFLVASKYTSKWLVPIFMTLSAFAFYFVYKSPVSLIALGASLLGCFGSFAKNQKILRAVFCICATAWLIHNFLVGSIVGTLMEAAFITSNVVGWVRMYRTKKEPPSLTIE